MLKCELCKREFKNYTSLGSHISQSHRDITTKGYYDKFIKTIYINPKLNIYFYNLNLFL